MPSIDSTRVRRALTGKTQAEEDRGRDDPYYLIRDHDGRVVGSTSISHGAKEPLGAKRIAQMARQLHLDTVEQFARLVECPLSRDEALTIMTRNWPPGSSRLIRR